MNVLFLPLNKKETRWGLVIAAVYLAVSAVLETQQLQAVQCFFVLPVFAAVVILARRFFKESFCCIPLTGKQVIWKPLLGALACKALCFLVHDLFLLLGFPYFTASDWGPMLWDIRGALLERSMQDHFWFIALVVVLLIPVVEEFLFRGVILGTLYRKNSILAVIVSVVLFALFHTLPYAAAAFYTMQADATLYLCLYSFQFIAMGLFLAWLYIGTDSIFAPIIMHIIYNYALIF